MSSLPFAILWRSTRTNVTVKWLIVETNEELWPHRFCFHVWANNVTSSAGVCWDGSDDLYSMKPYALTQVSCGLRYTEQWRGQTLSSFPREMELLSSPAVAAACLQTALQSPNTATRWFTLSDRMLNAFWIGAYLVHDQLIVIHRRLYHQRWMSRLIKKRH